MSELFKQIEAAKTPEIAALTTNFDQDFLKAAAFSVGRDFRSLEVDIETAKEMPVLIEMKSILFPEMVSLEQFDPLLVLKSLQQIGLNAGLIISTDPYFLGGDPGWINLVKRRMEYPVVQRDFFLDPVQIYQGKAIGSDAFILDPEITPSDKIVDVVAAINEMGLEVYLETPNGFLPKNLNPEEVHGVVVNVDCPANGFVRNELEGYRKNIPEGCLALIRTFPQNGSDVKLIKESGFQCMILSDAFWQQPDFSRTYQEIQNWTKAL